MRSQDVSQSWNAEKVRVGVGVCEQIPNTAIFRVVHYSECQTSRCASFLHPSPFTQIRTIRLAFSSILSTLPPPVSTTIAASFLTAIMTPPEVQLTLYNSLVLRATAAAIFPLLFRIFTSYSVYKPQRHPFYFLYPPKNIFRCTMKTHSSARISAILPLSSFCSVFCCSSILSCSCWW